MYKSKFGWEEIFKDEIIDVRFCDPTFTFTKQCQYGKFDKVSDEYYNALLKHVSAISDFFLDNDSKYCLSDTFVGGLVSYLLCRDISVDNIVLILKRLADIFGYGGNIFLLDGVHTGFRSSGSGSTLSVSPIIYSCSVDRNQALTLCRDLISVYRIESSKLCIRYNGEVSIPEINEDFKAFVYNTLFVRFLSLFGLSSYADKDWDVFEKQVQDENERKGLNDFSARCELWQIGKTPMPTDTVSKKRAGLSSSRNCDIKTVNVTTVGCYALNSFADVDEDHAGDEINFYPDRWCPDGVDWLNNGYINGVSVLDILESGTIGLKGLASDDGSFVIDEPQDFSRDWGQRSLCLKVYKDVTVEYRYPEPEETNESDESDK